MSGRVHVVGSANVDRTIRVDRAPAPGETVLGGTATPGPGGKGLNQAVASARLGTPTSFTGAVGRDADGDLLASVLEEEGVDASALARVDQPTGLAIVLLEPDGANRIVVAPGANSHAEIGPDGPGVGDVLVLQLEVPLPLVARALAAAREAGAVTLLNAAPARDDLGEVLSLVDVLVVNEPELQVLDPVGPDPGRDDRSGSAHRVLAEVGTVVTLGPAGALVATAHGDRRVPAPPVDVVDTTGAGDCFVGALASGLAAGRALGAASELAVEAASRSVTVAGAASSMPTRAALASWFSDHGPGTP